MFEPFPTPMGLAIYFTTWWIVLFAVLPFGVKSQDETGEIVKGSEPGAPVVHGLAWKALWTTLISAALFAGLIAWLRAYP